MATATGPITIPRINYTYTVGQGFLTTIQRAVSYAMTATGYGDVIIPQGYTGTDNPASVAGGSNLVFIIDTRNGQRKTYAWSGSAYVLQPLTADSAVFTNLEANTANFDSCIVHDSPVRTFANTPGGGDIAMVWPEIGVPISEGDHWRDPSIDPNTLALTDQSNIFSQNQFIEGIVEITPNNTVSPIPSGTYGLRIGWNGATRNETDFINGNNYGTGAQGGGFYWYNENPNVPINPATTPSMSLDGNNNLTVGGTGNFSGNVIVGGDIDGSGNMYLNGSFGAGISQGDAPTFRLSSADMGLSVTWPHLHLWTSNGNGNIYGHGNIIATNALQAGLLEQAVPDSNVRRWRLSLPNDGKTGYNYTGQFLFATQTPDQNPNNDVLSLWHTSESPGFGEVLIATFTSSSVRINSPSLFAGNIYNSNFIQTDTLTANTHIWTTNIDVSGSKNFRIPHPTNKKKQLVHSSLEGPEAGVFYRGEGKTKNYKAVIKLPAYFESLVAKDNRTVQLTAILDDGDDEPFGFLAAGRVIDGKFKVHSSEETQRFYWEVKAIRGDLPPLEVEPDIPKEKKAA